MTETDLEFDGYIKNRRLTVYCTTFGKIKKNSSSIKIYPYVLC